MCVWGGGGGEGGGGGGAESACLGKCNGHFRFERFFFESYSNYILRDSDVVGKLNWTTYL